VLGTAEIDVDWSAPVEPMRAELRAVCEGTELWDGRVCVLQVTEAVGGMIRLRALVSAHDAGSLWDLRCLVRERLVAWVFEHQRNSLPRLRADLAQDERVLPGRTAQQSAGQDAAARQPAAARPVGEAEAGGDARVFGGTGDGDERAVAFSGPDEQAAPAGSGMRQ
jgi:hypothetical protein